MLLFQIRTDPTEKNDVINRLIIRPRSLSPRSCSHAAFFSLFSFSSRSQRRPLSSKFTAIVQRWVTEWLKSMAIVMFDRSVAFHPQRSHSLPARSSLDSVKSKRIPRRKITVDIDERLNTAWIRPICFSPTNTCIGLRAKCRRNEANVNLISMIPNGTTCGIW